MRWSQTLIPTQKESPADAVALSHILLLRAGMIRQLGAGAYTYLPLGLRVLRKASEIVRQEMDAAGAVELLMPALHPLELWQEAGRDQTMKGVLMELTLTGDKKFVLGPTHEEPVTDIVRDVINSYKQLPITLYQIQTKFRDEPRPRFGVLRTREFIMKDAYSFGTGVEQLNASYDAMYEAYCRIFDRCGLPYVAVEAESGPIGGDSSHEFMVPCETGEDSVLHCAGCGYAANIERAEIGETTAGDAEKKASAPAYEAVETPGKRTIQDVCAFLGAKESESAKLMVYVADGKPVAALVRGDHEINEAKLRRAFGATSLAPADQHTVEKATGAPMGFLGPIDCRIPLVVDRSVAVMNTVVVGGNVLDVHLKGVVAGRDFPLNRVADVRNATPGDPCPRCGKPMARSQGIEIGHVFKLGTKYSVPMGATFLDEQGHSHPAVMGCYGIGVTRIVASAVEAGHDSNGIRWPLSLAPYEAIVVPLQVNNEAVMRAAEEIALALENAGSDVLIDDRDHRPGFKFKDADLIGIPLRVVVSERGLKEGTIELKWRHEEKAGTIPAEDAGESIARSILEAKNAAHRDAEARKRARIAARNRTS